LISSFDFKFNLHLRRFVKGSAHVFTRDVAGAASSGWTQRAKLVAADGAAGDEFGRNVSICNNTVVAGAWGNNAKVGRCKMKPIETRVEGSGF
jgi:hypothetical protein